MRDNYYWRKPSGGMPQGRVFHERAPLPWPLLEAALSHRLRRRWDGFDMTHDDPSKTDRRTSERGADKYGGMVEFDMAMTPSVIICGVAGAVLGAILAMWGTTEIPIIFATVIVFAVLSGIFGFFVPWYKPR